MMTWRSRRNVRPCTLADVKHSATAKIHADPITSMTGRIHILVSHAMLTCLYGYAAPSTMLLQHAWNRSWAVTMYSRSLRSLRKYHASRLSTTDVRFGPSERSILPCGARKSVYFWNRELHFVCVEHGFTKRRQR